MYKPHNSNTTGVLWTLAMTDIIDLTILYFTVPIISQWNSQSGKGKGRHTMEQRGSWGREIVKWMQPGGCMRWRDEGNFGGWNSKALQSFDVVSP